MQLGAQLYTTRALCQTEADFAATVQALAHMGYTHVQISSFWHDPAFMRQACDTAGIHIALTHIPPERIANDTATVIAEHQTLGCNYVGVGALPEAYRGGSAGMRQFLRDYAPAMQQLQRHGMRLQYHNHSAEFHREPDGATAFHTLLHESDPAQLGITLDVYWAQYAGCNLCELIPSLAGRVELCHLKDLQIEGWNTQRYAPVGSGNLSWTSILPALASAGCHTALVEQDDCYGADPLALLQTSLEFCRNTPHFH